MRPVLERLRGDGPGNGDSGFTLVEVVIAFVLLGVVMVGATSLIVRSLTTTDSLSDRQTAAALADQALDTVRGVKANLLAQGRTPVAIAALRVAGTTLVDTSIDDTTSAAAIAATTGTGTLLLPTSVPATVGSTTYAVKTFIEACWMADGTVVGGATPEQCGPTQASGRRLVYRITAEVTWPRLARGCRGPNPTTCSYDTSTLRDPSVDPVFPSTLSAPTLASRSPSGVIPVGLTVSMTLTGTGFQQGAYVKESGLATVGTPTLTATTASFSFTADSSAGTYQLVLVNPDGGRTNSLSVVVGTSQPTVTSVAYTGAGGSGPCLVNSACQFTVTGTGFYVSGSNQIPSVALYPFGNGSTYAVNNVSFVNATTMTFTSTPTGANTYNSYVTVTNPDGGAATSPTFSWLVTSPAPTITSVGIVGALGSGQCTILTNCQFTVTGTGFVSGGSITMTVNGSAYTISNGALVNSTKITYTARSILPGNYQIVVTETNPDGGRAAFTTTWTVTLF